MWSELFRVALLRRRQVIPVGLDSHCVRPFDLPDGYGFGMNDEGGVLPGVGLACAADRHGINPADAPAKADPLPRRD